MFEHLTRNIRHGASSLAARPGFTIAAIVTLAIGIGASTTLFSVFDTVLFSPVRGVGAPQDLVEMGVTSNDRGFSTFSYPDFEDLAARAKPFADLFAYKLESLNVGGAGTAQRAGGLLVSSSYFNTLQVSAWRGRLLQAADYRAGAAPAVVATYAAWRKHFNSDETAIGKPVLINGHAFTLVGVAAPEFHGTIALLAPEFYLPLAQRPLLLPAGKRLLDERASSWLMVGARLVPGTSRNLVQTQLSGIQRQLASEHPSKADKDEARAGVSVVPMRAVPGGMRTGLTAFSGLLFTLVSLILLIACVNVASMLLAHGEGRRHDIAVRFALGATRRHVLAQLLTESVLLALAAGATGVLLSMWACRLLEHLHLPTPVPVVVDFPVSGGALLFALACSLATAMVFGLLPALRVSRRTPNAGDALTGRQITTARSRLAGALVVTQVAFTMVLLVSGGLFARALERAAAIDPGFDAQHVLAADFNLEPSGYVETRQQQAQQQLLDQVGAMPGVEHAALAALVPMDFSRMTFGDFRTPGGTEPVTPDVNLVSAGFFTTLGIDVRGRGFDSHDVHDGAGVCVVNATLANRLASDGDVLGRSFPFGSDGDLRTLTVVGIVPDGKYASLDETTQPFLFLPLTQWPRADASLIVTTTLTVDAFATQLRATLRNIDASLPASQVRPLTDVLALSLLPQRIAGMVSGALGVVGLVLVAIGLYGLIAIFVARRTREFGVRLALGADPQRVRRDVMRRGTRLLAVGLAVGLVLSFGCAMLISSLLFGAGPGDAPVFVIAAAVLAVTTLAACWLPARRAARITPLEALRWE